MRSRSITSQAEIRDIIKRSLWCHVAMIDPQGLPYLVPLNFGFRDDVIYLHGAQQGKKIDCMRNNPNVCINFSIDQQLRYQSEEVACSWSMKYRSVLAYGKAEFIEDSEEKITSMNIIMAQYTGREFDYNPPSIREVNVWKIKVEKFEGRVYGY